MRMQFVLTGTTPLLVHADDVEKADLLTDWRKASENKNLSKAGDDRSPAWTWQTYLYTDGNVLTIPSDNLMVALRQAGAEIKIKGNKTFKAETQSGMFIPAEHLPLLVDGQQIAASKVEDIVGDANFAEHADAAKALGFRLFVKRAKVGQSKHIRVRPRFDEWSIIGEIEVVAKEITAPVVKQLFTIAGRKGLCDWRPTSPKAPGAFGMFTAEVTELK
jgi:hypothetical protein